MKKNKFHKFIVKRAFDGQNEGGLLSLPKGYIFRAKSRCYAKNLVECYDLQIKTDMDQIKMTTFFIGVPCSFVRFHEED